MKLIPTIFNMAHFPIRSWVRHSLRCLGMALLLWSQACSDDNNTPADTTPPQIVSVSLTDGQTVRNTVKTAVEAADETRIQKIDIYIDGTLLTSLTSEPFETNWDTNNVKDGQHTVKFVVTDRGGNTTEKSVTISVSNVLVSIDIASDQLFNNGGRSERGFVFLSGADGKLIAATEYKNGQNVELKSPGFEGENFFLTEVLVTSVSGEDDDIRAWTFAAIERGKNWVVLNNQEDEEAPSAGTVTLNFNNIADGSTYNITSNGESTYANNTHTSDVISLTKNPTSLYVVRYSDTDPRPLGYNLISNIAAGATYPIDLGTVTKELTKMAAYKPDYAKSVAFTITGYPNDEYKEGYQVWNTHLSNSEPTMFDFYYPGNAFPFYTSALELAGDGFIMYRQDTAPKYNYEKPSPTTNFTFSGNTLTVAALDNGLSTLAIPFENATTLWYYLLPEGSHQTIPSLEIPQSLSAWSFPQLDQPISYELYYYGDIRSYDDLKTYIRQSENSIDDLFDEGKGLSRNGLYNQCRRRPEIKFSSQKYPDDALQRMSIR